MYLFINKKPINDQIQPIDINDQLNISANEGKEI